jgi:hypothetical protein
MYGGSVQVEVWSGVRVAALQQTGVVFVIKPPAIHGFKHPELQAAD